MLEQIGFKRFNFPNTNTEYAYFLNKQGTFVGYKTPDEFSAMRIDINKKNPITIAYMDSKNFYSWNFSKLIPFPRITKKTKEIIKPEDIEAILEREEKPFLDLTKAIYEVAYKAILKKENYKHRKKFLDQIEFPRPPEKIFCVNLERIIDRSLQSLEEFFREYSKKNSKKLF